MSSVWERLTGGGSKRVDALEREIAAMRNAHAQAAVDLRAAHEATRAAIQTEAERSYQAARLLLDLSERVAALEARGSALETLTATTAEDAEASDQRARDQSEDVARLRAAVLRLEKQMERDAEEARKVATGLLQRIEASRAGSVAAPAAS